MLLDHRPLCERGAKSRVWHVFWSSGVRKAKFLQAAVNLKVAFANRYLGLVLISSFRSEFRLGDFIHASTTLLKIQVGIQDYHQTYPAAECRYIFKMHSFAKIFVGSIDRTVFRFQLMLSASLSSC